MPVYRYYQRGRRILSFPEAANRAAIALGEFIPYPALPPWWRRCLTFVWLLLRLGRKPSLPAPPPPNPRYLWWAGLHHPLDEATGHFLVLGGTGSGKTKIIDSAVESFLAHFRPGSDQRAFIFDLKREQYSRLMNLDLTVPVVLADPFDQRGSAWDMAADVTSSAETRQCAACLVPEGRNESDKFWTNSTRNILAAVMENLAELNPGKWTLRDVLLVMRSRERLAHFLEARPETAHLWAEATKDERTTSNLMASFNAQLSKFETVATLWAQCPRKFSLKQWVKADSVLLVTSHPKFSAVLQPIHQVLIELAGDLVLSEPDSRTRRTWFVLDEARELGRVRLNQLANLGRSKGVSLILGLQSVEGFYEACGGSEHLAHEILGQLRNVTCLRGNSPTTAAYVEKYFGTVEWLVEKVTHSTGYSAKGGASSNTSTDHSTVREAALMASEIMSIAPPSERQPVVLFNDVPTIGCYVAAIPLQEFLQRLRPPHPTIPNVIEVLPKQMRFKEWQAADAKRLKLPSHLLRLPAPPADLLLAQLNSLQGEPS